jgi:hypothetical protein
MLFLNVIKDVFFYTNKVVQIPNLLLAEGGSLRVGHFDL